MSTQDLAPDPHRLAAIAGLVEKYKMALNNKKRRTLLGLNDKAFHAYELGLIVSRCCRVRTYVATYPVYIVVLTKTRFLLGLGPDGGLRSVPGS
jgi:hypothetical protein